LCAPRPFIAADAWDDQWCNGNALKQSWLAAMPVYEFSGAKEKLGIHFRAGGHALAPEDWGAILDFADQQLRGMNSGKKFDQLPSTDLLQ
jgi:endo-1,4-beta-xylanase